MLALQKEFAMSGAELLRSTATGSCSRSPHAALQLQDFLLTMLLAMSCHHQLSFPPETPFLQSVGFGERRPHYVASIQSTRFTKKAVYMRMRREESCRKSGSWGYSRFEDVKTTRTKWNQFQSTRRNMTKHLITHMNVSDTLCYLPRLLVSVGKPLPRTKASDLRLAPLDGTNNTTSYL